MKSKILFLLLFTAGFSFGQVPNTTSFSLQDVVTTVGPTTNDLTDCFNDAIPDYFNYAYYDDYYTTYGNLNNKLMFRNYGPINAFYDYIPSGSGAYTLTANSLLVPAPPNVANGDLLIMAVAIYGNGNIDVPAGWNYYTTVTGTGFAHGLFYKTANNEGWTTVSYSSTNQVFTAQIHRVTAALTFDLAGVSGAEASNVSTLSGSVAVTRTFAIAIFISYYASPPGTSTTITKDFQLANSAAAGSTGNTIHIYAACAKTGYQKWKWDSGTANSLKCFIIPVY